MPDSPIPKETLEAALKQAAKGDQDAWRLIVETYSPRVFGLLRGSCGDVDLAEEITQSTFCTIVAKIGEYTEVGRFQSWLFRIAMNRLRDEMRRRKRHAVSVEEHTLTGLIGAGPGRQGGGNEPGPDEALVARLHAGLARLPEADQRIIHLRHVAGLSFKQIADLLEQPLGTVLARQHRALKKLADYVGGGGP